MNRFKLSVLVVIVALSFAAMQVLPASAQGMVEYKLFFLCTTGLAPDGTCLGDILAVWNLPDGAVAQEGCQDTVIFNNTLLEPLYCRYTFEGETFELNVEEIPWERLIPAVSLFEFLASEAESQSGPSVAEIQSGSSDSQTSSMVDKLANAIRLWEEQRYLPAGGLLAAFVYEGTALVKGDTNPDFLPWGMLLEISDAMKAYGIFKLTE